MSILQGTIFESNTRMFLDSEETSTVSIFNVVEGPFLVSDEEGGFENFRVWNSYVTLQPGSVSEFESVEDHIQQYEEINAALSTKRFRPSGIGPITALLELDDIVYAARTLADGTGSQLYRVSDVEDLTGEVVWETVDMGYEVAFDGGRNRPVTVADRQFLDVAPEPSDPIVDRGPTTGDSIATVRSTTGGAQGTNGDGRWLNIENLYPDTKSGVAVASRKPSVNAFREHFTQTLQLRGFVTEDDADPNAKITGFLVNLAFEQEVFGNDTSPYGLLSVLRLLNVDGSDNKGSVAVGDRIAMTTSSSPSSLGNKYTTGTVLRTEGGAADTWGANNLSTSRILSPDFGIELEMGSKVASSVATDRKFYVESCEITVYFEDGTEKVYFWDSDTDTDVSEADVIEVQRLEGLWENDDAAGFMTLYNVTNPGDIVNDLEIRSASGGSGSLIALTSAAATKNLLPSWEDMQSNNALVQQIKANFFIDADKEAIYGVSGAGPAFNFNGEYFRFIHAPIPIEKDKPRHIIEHESHLVLAYPSGSILVSVVGQPDNFAGIDGAAEFGFGDTITDLAPLSGSAIAVLCRESAHALVGTTLDNFSTQVISKTSGALEYSAVIIGAPIYADFRGINSIQNTNQFGDFSAGRLSQRVTQLVQGRTQDISGVSINLQDLVCAIPIRGKNQYRMFFNDGYILTMTLFGAADEQPIFTVQKYGVQKDTLESPDSTYVPTAILSTVLSRGAELNMIGTKSGDIYVLDQGTGILNGNGIINYYASLTFTPFNGGEPHTNLKYNEILIHGQTSGGQELVTSAGVNYLIPDPSTQTDEITMGSVNSEFYLKRVPQKKSTHLPNVTSGFSLKIESQADGNIPHIIQALTFRPTLVGDQSVGQKRYVGPVDTDI